MTPRAEFAAGVKAEAPLLLGVLPFGLIFGALAVAAGIPPAPALAMSSIVLAGSAQFVGMELFSAGAPGPIILLTTFVVNLRHMLYSASLGPYVTRLRPAWKTLLAYLLTDEAYAVAVTHYQEAGTQTGNRHWFFLGAGMTLWVGWQVSTATGIFLGARIPASLHLEFALPLTFMALVRPAVTDRATAAAALTAGVVAILADGLALRLGIVVAAVCGIAAGLLTERS